MTVRGEIRKIKAQMKREGIEQQAVAERMGVNKSTVSRILRGEQMPSAETFLALQLAVYRQLPKAA